jgi:plastocyanin
MARPDQKEACGGRLRPRVLTAAAAAVMVVALPACGGSTKHKTATHPGGGTTVAAAAGDQSITIKNFAFSPSPMNAKAGATITITNNDTTDHTVTDTGGTFDTGHIAPGSVKTIVLTTAGSYSYHCNIHQFMKGLIQVNN